MVFKKSLCVTLCIMIVMTLFSSLVVAQTPINLALGKPFTTTLDNTQRQDIVTDGKTYSTPYLDVLGTGIPVAVTVYLKEAYDINQIKVWHYWADNRTYYGTKTEVSEDGQNWYVIFDSSVSGTYQETYDGRTYNFPVRKVRYIRDWLNGSTANAFNHWVEIQAFGPENSSATIQNSGWSWEGEAIDGLAGRFSGPVTLSTDKVVGKYSVKVITKDDPYNAAHYGFWSTFKDIDTDFYSKVSFWVKPGPNAKWVVFYISDSLKVNNASYPNYWAEYITSDKNHDGYFKLGEDLESGKWNKITIDLKQTNLGGVQKLANALQIVTNEFSTWYWDEIKTEYSPVTKLNISTIPDTYTQLVNGSVRYKLAAASLSSNSLSWNFNQDGNYEGWTMYNQSGTVSGGVINLSSWGIDPYIISSDALGINAATTRFIKIRMKNSTSSQMAQIYWITNNDGNWTDYKSKVIPINPNSDYTEYVVDIGSNSFWRDTIRQLRIDPGVTSGAYYIDYITLQTQADAAFITTPTVLATSTDPNAFPKGKIEKISINSNYVDAGGTPTQLQSSNKLLAANASKMIVSGNGNKVFYLNSSDGNKLYLFDKSTNVNKKLLDYTDIGEIKTGYWGGVLFFTRYDGVKHTLWYYDTRDNSSKLMANILDPSKFAILNEHWNVLYYNNYNGSDYISVQDIRGGLWNWLQVWGVTSITAREPHWFYSVNQGTNGVIKKLSWNPTAWKETELISSPKLLNINQMLVNKDATLLYIRVGQLLYSLDVKNKVLRQLEAEKAGNLVKVSDDNKVYYTDIYGDFMVYEPNSDTSTRIRPDNAGNSIFAVDNPGTTMFYDASSGIYVSDLRKNIKPDKYLLSFDGKQTWVTFKNGKYEKVSNGYTPTVDDLQNKGMTSDEVNVMDTGDFSQLYQDGQEVYSVDIAVLFQTPSSAISPQLNSITVTMSGEGITGITLQYPKQQVDYNSSKWRSIKKIYPIEIQPKEAEVLYFLSNDGGTTLKAYKNGQWNTYQSTILSQPSENWDVIMQIGMINEEIRNIPSDQLTNLLPANQTSVIYVMKIDDTSTAEYSSKITIDYGENLFDSTLLTLKINYLDGTFKDYPNLTKTQVEDFMEWVNERQYNKGPIFYCLKTVVNGVEVNDFINYYSIKSVSVNDTP